MVSLPRGQELGVGYQTAAKMILAQDGRRPLGAHDDGGLRRRDVPAEVTLLELSQRRVAAAPSAVFNLVPRP